MQKCNTSSLQPLKTRLQAAYDKVQDMSCDTSINEVFLLHGTKPDILFNVLSNGLDEGFSDGLFGQVFLRLSAIACPLACCARALSLAIPPCEFAG